VNVGPQGPLQYIHRSPRSIKIHSQVPKVHYNTFTVSLICIFKWYWKQSRFSLHRRRCTRLAAPERVGSNKRHLLLVNAPYKTNITRIKPTAIYCEIVYLINYLTLAWLSYNGCTTVHLYRTFINQYKIQVKAIMARCALVKGIT